MKKKSIQLIIALTAFSLVGLIATQLFWVNNAFKLAETQYDNRVTIALQGALDEYVQSKERLGCDPIQGCLGASEYADSLFINLVPEEMDSILKVHFDFHGLDSVFSFSVIKCISGEVIYSRSGFTTEPENISTHRISLSCLHHEDSHHLEVGFGSRQKLVLKEIMLWLVASFIFLIVVVMIFAYTFISIIRQKKISDIRNDFINNMTHEFKTPISNISLASEVLRRKETLSQPERIDKYASIIYEENQRMRSQVERVLEAAVRDRDDTNLKLEACDPHQLIREAVDHMCFPECESDTQILLDFHAEKSELIVDPMHFSNIIHNLLDNAKKYSEGPPIITIGTRIKGKKFLIEVSDNGIGMTADTQKHIFDKFYRVPTGNLHNVKGFGLGLNYVKKMVEEHGGSISIKSEYGKGSTFRLQFPLENH